MYQLTPSLVQDLVTEAAAGGLPQVDPEVPHDASLDLQASGFAIS
jgi:hypothetical protein